MKITNLIDRDYLCVSALEDMRDIAEWLKENDYLTVIGQEFEAIGIVTFKDVQHNPCHCRVIDCNITKPHAGPDQTIFEVFNLMKAFQTDFLPVYHHNEFIGVIALMALTERLAGAAENVKQNYQQVIHDLRNPINNIHGLSALLYESITDQESRTLVQLCNLSCKHAMDILDDLLFVETDESKPLQKAATEMNAFYQQCIDEQLGLSLLKHIEITSELCTDKVIREIDRGQVKRAIQNVLSNAVKFSYPHTTIKVSSKLIEGKLILKIVDAGIGIPPHLQAEVFKKFTPAQREGTNGEVSTGLGLCFAKQCIEHHNGHIYLKSTEGKGTKFYISL
jgi:signal transduction histidine kinase